MFYKNNSATLHTDLDIIDKDFVLIDEKEYKEIKEKNDYIIEWQSHVQKTIYQTKKETKVDKVIDADGKEVILRTYEVETPILDEKWNPIIKEKVREIARYNPYDVEWYTPINDKYTIITEEEHNKLKEEQQAKLQTI